MGTRMIATRRRHLATRRPGRMRHRERLRALLRETRLAPEQLVMPLFVRHGRGIRAPIPSMPGQHQFSVDQLVRECQQAREQGIGAVLLFGIPDRKDDRASRAHARDGIVQQALHELKTRVPDLVTITDVCLCAYMSHGHCGVVRQHPQRAKPARTASSPARGGAAMTMGEREYRINRELTLELLEKTALSHAQAGADLVAPSDMTDGNVGAVRRALDEAGFDHTAILAYSVKYASAFYGPFRQATGSAPAFGDRRAYQMDIANADEALREAALDLEEGADIVMVKPALPYLDVIRLVKQELRCPVAAFSVSGEYAMVKAVAARGWIPERPAWLELLIGCKRAGADLLITYWAKDAAAFLGAS